MGKKIYINENKLKCLFEDYNQMVIPFETIKDKNGKTLFYGNDNGRKLNYQYFMDFLESFGKKDTLQPSDFNWKMAIDAAKLDAFDELCYQSDKYMVIDTMFHGYYRAEDFVNVAREMLGGEAELELLNKEAKIIIKREEIPEEVEGISEEVDITYGYSDFFDIMSEYFNYTEDDFLGYISDYDKKYYIEKKGHEYGFPDGIECDERGLIYVEREITIPFYLDNTYKDIHSNFYNKLNSDYGEHVGQYWSWAKGCAEAYDGNSYNNKNTRVVFCGYVDPKSVDWEQTTLKSSWAFQEEREIEIEYGEAVEVDAVYLKVDGSRKFNLIKEPMIVYA